jgi:hypothetical protein
MIVVTTIVISSAPRTRMAISASAIPRPMTKVSVATLTMSAGTTGGTPRPGRRHEAAVDQADEQDEQADADRDRALQVQRDGVHDRLAQPGQHEDQ